MQAITSVSFKIKRLPNAPGFRLAYQIASCSQTYRLPHDRLLSPSWPVRLPRNTSCTFTIAVDQGRFISLYFRFFSLASSPNCSSTYLEVRLPSIPYTINTYQDPGRLLSICSSSEPTVRPSTSPHTLLQVVHVHPCNQSCTL